MSAAISASPLKSSSADGLHVMPGSSSTAILIDLDRVLGSLVLGRTNHLQAWIRVAASLSAMDRELINAASTLILEKVYHNLLHSGLEDEYCMATLLCSLSLCMERGARPALQLDDLLRWARELRSLHGVILCMILHLSSTDVISVLSQQLRAEPASRKRKFQGKVVDGGE